MTCPDCGARNTPDAPWCTQCLRPLGGDEPPPPAETAGDTLWPSSSAASPPQAAAPAPRPVPGPDAAERDVRSVDGVVEWRCPTCRSWNPLEVPRCGVCGQGLGASMTGEGRDQIVGRVSRTRRVLWIAAGLGAVMMAVAVVLLVATLRSGAGG